MKIEPLNDGFTRNCPFWKNKFDHYLDSINEQLASRPEVWGVGLWQDAETERVAKGIAELWVSYGEVKSTSFIPADKLRIIELADYEWGLVSSNLDDIEREFNCKIDVEELISNEEMTFGDLARIVREREGSHQPEPVDVGELTEEVKKLRNDLVFCRLWSILMIPIVFALIFMGAVAFASFGDCGGLLKSALIVWPVISFLYIWKEGFGGGVLSIAYRLAWVGIITALALKHIPSEAVDAVVAWLR